MTQGGPRVRAGTLTELDRAQVLVVALAAGASGRPREALVVRDEDGCVRAYENLCRHLPIPLDAGSRVFLSSDQLVCGTHGARYRKSDGLCVLGPCRGERLHALGCELEGDELYVVDLAPAAP